MLSGSELLLALADRSLENKLTLFLSLVAEGSLANKSTSRLALLEEESLGALLLGTNNR